MYTVSRLERGIYHAHLYGRTDFDELLSMRRSLAALAVEHQEQLTVIVWQLDVWGKENSMGIKGIQHYLEKRQPGGSYSIHIGLEGFPRGFVGWVHRLFPHLLPKLQFADDIPTALLMARRLRDASFVMV